MVINECLLAQLKRHEGLRLKPYLDTVGKLTIGYGRNLYDRGVTEEEAEEMLRNDIEIARHLLNQYSWFQTLNDVRKECLVNMVLNLGIGKFLLFKRLIKALQAANYTSAAEEMLDSKWAQQTGRRATELAAQMRTGKYADTGK